jgi:hypothetical protein
MSLKKNQKGGTSLYGPTLEAMKAQGNMGAGRARIPHGPTTSTCNAESPQRSSLPFVGGGLDYSKVNGVGHRPILAHPGFGYSNGENNVLFKGARPTTTSYNSSSCHSGGKKKRKSRKGVKKRRKSLKKRKSRKVVKKRRKSLKKRKSRNGVKRRRKSLKKRKSRKRVKRRIKSGQRGGGSVHLSFPGPIDKSLTDYRLWKDNGLIVKNNFNCPDTYNHFTKN